MSCAAGYHAILEMERTNAPVLAGRAADKLCQGLQAIIDDLDLPFFVYNHGSIIHLETHGVLLVDTTDPDFFTKVMQRKEIAEEMGAAYTAEGVITLAGLTVKPPIRQSSLPTIIGLIGFADRLRLIWQAARSEPGHLWFLAGMVAASFLIEASFRILTNRQIRMAHRR